MNSDISDFATKSIGTSPNTHCTESPSPVKAAHMGAWRQFFSLIYSFFRNFENKREPMDEKFESLILRRTSALIYGADMDPVEPRVFSSSKCFHYRWGCVAGWGRTIRNVRIQVLRWVPFLHIGEIKIG